jgi:hypothetical protein
MAEGVENIAIEGRGTIDGQGRGAVLHGARRQHRSWGGSGARVLPTAPHLRGREVSGGHDSRR